MTDERKAFEAWHLKEYPHSSLEHFRGEYIRDGVRCRWIGWQARAALTQATATAAPLPSSPESAGSHSPNRFYASSDGVITGIDGPDPAGVAQEAGDKP
jgi:hypothetical protein